MKTTFSFESIGTHWQINIEETLSTQKQTDLYRQITDRIEQFDKTYSRFREDSLVTQMAKKKGKYLFPDDAKDLLTLYKKMYDITDGAVTPFIGDLLISAGYDANYSLQPKTLRSPYKWEEAIIYDYPNISIKRPTMLDFGSAGKGYLIDIVGDLLEKNSIHAYTIDAGGDILYKTTKSKKLRVGLEHPENPKQVIGVAEIRNESICCSAGNRRKWKDFHHIINPHTLSSPKNILSVWTIANSALVADAMTTGLFFVPAQKLHGHFTFSYAILYNDYSLETSKDFPAEIFTTANTRSL